MPPESLNVLIVNSGSSSLKFSVLEANSGRLHASGIAERLNTAEASFKISAPDKHRSEIALPSTGYRLALQRVASFLGDDLSLKIAAVGHRVVHGGERFRSAVRIDAAVLEQIEALTDLAPLHNPPSAEGIKLTLEFYPGCPQVAVFDTAFHHTLAPEVFHYAVPYEFYEKYRIRRYGFHGTSYRYITEELARRFGRNPESLQFVAAHLGNGCSATAIRDGKSVDTTMGLTPLEGLVMGTRSGDVDPALHQTLQRLTSARLAEITDWLTKKSGLLGLSGLSHDMRQVLEAKTQGNARAELAFAVFCFRLARALMGLTASLGRVDAMVFTC
ncbi:MAG: acetate/propionate family kinase, partial [Verrucomicrobia bacterium]|nr:acetate/propionate family kinase [Verrucomicrobiota bacterium]